MERELGDILSLPPELRRDFELSGFYSRLQRAVAQKRHPLLCSNPSSDTALMSVVLGSINQARFYHYPQLSCQLLRFGADVVHLLNTPLKDKLSGQAYNKRLRDIIPTLVKMLRLLHLKLQRWHASPGKEKKHPRRKRTSKHPKRSSSPSNPDPDPSAIGETETIKNSLKTRASPMDRVVRESCEEERLLMPQLTAGLCLVARIASVNGMVTWLVELGMGTVLCELFPVCACMSVTIYFAHGLHRKRENDSIFFSIFLQHFNSQIFLCVIHYLPMHA
jgi:hypothetical protein